ncbi:thiamine pyrophosphate-dependent enzyme [Brevibacterium oceani]|uniref:thiamine pyrophosphate-dependent enzyme n=1 Tax=Brevibacterium oceani TaxID=358099 RepID=UPI0031B833C6
MWGDAKTTLAALQPHLTQHQTEWQEKIAEENRDWTKENTWVAQTEADPINPRRVFVSLNERLPENAIITCDAGSTADWYGFHIELGPNQMGNLSGRMASMLAAMPYALAGKFAHPDRPVVCTIGDGAFQMMGMNGLLNVKRHWQEWSNSTFVVLVINNGDLNQVSWEMREAGDPRWDTAQLVESMDYAGYAELLGLRGIAVDDPEDIDAAFDQAFAADRPVVLDVRCDRNTPPLPAHIAFAQAKGLAESLLGGDPELGQVVKQSSRATAARLFARMGLTSDD